MLVYAEAGENFYSAVKRIQDSLFNDKDYLDLEFNGIRIRVGKTSLIDDLATIYDLRCEIRRLKIQLGQHV